ncbi:Protein GAMETE EXPRESSED 1 [Mizuhopecten yessoensis]|uniref:Protein GAMETE EXPRESSED 1 n=2 Tax=Mizuhopecten yessoensis TaxID=6573 RepID=A0A210PF53_MIZYE|nr:Protein GAMETE EXPRESSED 1 [Mizuhopecten yessoensis]
MNSHTKRPIYGQCWKDTLVKIKTGCRDLTDVVQSRMALSYLNCFLKVNGRTVYTCGVEDPVHECTQAMSDTDMSTFATFFTQTHNICYFLEAQNWQNEAEQTISKLAKSSANVVEILEDSAIHQQAIIHRQNLTLENQDIILLKATNLSNVILTASTNVFDFFSVLEKRTFDQKLLINDIFDKVAKLQTTVLGGFSRFYSLVYYTLSVIVSCLLTSASRTAGARFWLLAIMTVNIIVERLFIYYFSGSFSVKEVNKMTEAEIEETVYTYQWLCREVSAILSIAVLVFYIYIYRNLKVINNQLLLKLKKQNSELKHQVKELSKDISIIRHYIMNQPIADSDDSDAESSSKILPARRKQKKSISPLQVLPTTANANETNIEADDRSEITVETSDREQAVATSGTETSSTSSGAEGSGSRSEGLGTSPIARRSMTTSDTERSVSTSGADMTPLVDTPQSSGYSLRSMSRPRTPP